MGVVDDLLATAGDADANTYATLAEAATYVEGRIDCAAWNARTDAEKARLLMDAAVVLDALPISQPPHDDNEGPLRFPTWGCEDDSDSLIIPAEVRDACCEIAFTLASSAGDNVQQIAALRAQGVTAMTEGRLSITLGGKGAGTVPDRAIRLLRRGTEYNEYEGWLLKGARLAMTL
jgi:hypothetical protein